MFTPELVQWYNTTRQLPEFKDRLEIVYVSSDNSEEDFNEYYAEMPWPAVAYQEKDVRVRKPMIKPQPRMDSSAVTCRDLNKIS